MILVKLRTVHPLKWECEECSETFLTRKELREHICYLSEDDIRDIFDRLIYTGYIRTPK